MKLFQYVLVVVVGYLLGSVNVSILISKLMGGDVRQKGSGNAGATNMARVYGLGVGVVTMALDMVKAALAMLGLCGEETRLPLVPASLETRKKLREALAELGEDPGEAGPEVTR